MRAVRGLGRFAAGAAGAAAGVAGGAVGGVTKAFRGLWVSSAPRPDASRVDAAAAAAISEPEAGAAAAVQLPANAPTHLDLDDEVLTIEMAQKLLGASKALKTVTIDGIPLHWKFVHKELERYKERPSDWNGWITAVTRIAITEFLEMALPEDSFDYDAALAQYTEIFVKAEKVGDKLVLNNGSSILALPIDKIRARYALIEPRKDGEVQQIRAAREANKPSELLIAEGKVAENIRLYNDTLTEYLNSLVTKIEDIQNPNHDAKTRTEKTLSLLREQDAFYKIDLPVSWTKDNTVSIDNPEELLPQVFGKDCEKYATVHIGQFSKLVYLHNFLPEELSDEVNEIREQLQVNFALVEDRLEPAVRPAAAANRVVAAAAAALAPQ